MAKQTETAAKKKPIEQYDHKGKKRPNNPPVGLVDAEREAAEGRKTYAYDPHLDPSLVWAGKAERTSFAIPTVSLHVHERIDPRSIIEAVRKKNGNDYAQMSLFNSKAENPPLREAIEFYKHAHNWSNRLVAGDSLLVMNSLLEKEGMAGQVQMIYFDPPYGIKYGSNFQPFVNKRDVKDGKDEDLTAEPEMIKAFRDTWELGLHSYLSYLRDRLLLARELLHESGSVFLQISDENVHHVREICDEVFGPKNFVATICYKKPGQRSSDTLPVLTDFVLWYARNKEQVKCRHLYVEKTLAGDGGSHYNQVELPDGTIRPLTDDERVKPNLLPIGAKVFQTTSLTSAGAQSGEGGFEFNGKKYFAPPHKHWSCSIEGLRRVAKAKRIVPTPTTIRYKRYFDDLPMMELDNRWNDVGLFGESLYVVQTSLLTIQRCVLMTSDPGDLVLDITCGSGTTAFVAEQWGRRWITCDTSRVALTLAKQRLMTSFFDFYQLAHEAEGVDSGFRYNSVPHITLKSIANNEQPEPETLYDQPFVDNSKTRVTGPFTVEAVPALMVKSLHEVAGEAFGVPASAGGAHDNFKPAQPADPRPAKVGTPDRASFPADASVARSGETLRQDEWRSELLRAGIRGKGGQMIRFSRVEPLSGTRWLHADAETKVNDDGANYLREGPAKERQRVVISFGPEHAPLEQKQVEMALEEARKLVPRPKLVVFAAFQFDPEAAKDIDELNWPGVTTLKAQMNADLLTEDLKKKRTSNESFWLIGQPDVVLRKVGQASSLPVSRASQPGGRKGGRMPSAPAGGDACPTFQVEVKGFDYYDTKTGQIVSGGPAQIALWMLDTDYDGRSLFARQVFFPMAGQKEGWSKLAKNLRAEIDEDLIEAYRGTVSLPFELGKHSRVAVKIVDDRGIESLKIIPVV